eukprot:CAMPEP_0172031492 /NCGR_PEP_ID=MMETSP1041-20130122/19335_1 /TAXON_ID=464988 /ORGANISM="Hemiselmis andersenii, Strain CCMP439" /LENGTH=36 /DNA_ID= /DNA_START= /DNA_END= /DNA_ORIENTATION=
MSAGGSTLITKASLTAAAPSGDLVAAVTVELSLAAI